MRIVMGYRDAEDIKALQKIVDGTLSTFQASLPEFYERGAANEYGSSNLTLNKDERCTR